MTKNIQKNFGIKIQEIRKAKGITQEKLAEMIGTSTRHMSRIETGANFPSPVLIERLSLYLETDLKSLFDFSSIANNIQIATGTNDSKILSFSVKNDSIDISTQTAKLQNQFEKAEKRKLKNKILQMLNETDYSTIELDYIITAIESIKDRKRLDDLIMIIKGIELAGK